jgi:hypothetical protein
MIIPAEIRIRGRKFYDSFFCKNVPGKRKLGDTSHNFIDTKALGQSSIIYSGGAGKNISFELQLIDLFNCTIFLFDPSPTGKNYIRTIKELPLNLNYFETGLAGDTGFKNFAEPVNSNEGSFKLSEK